MPPSADSLNRLGADLLQRGDSIGARLHFQAALKVDPGFLPAMANMAIVAINSRQLESAAAYLRRVVAQVPNDGNQWSNLGNALARLEQWPEAERALDRALELVPEYTGAWLNKALMVHSQGRHDEALELLARAEALGGGGHRLQNDRAHILLARGDIAEGLAAYEARWHTLRHLLPWDFHIPEWQGESLTDKHILLHGEQGFGDTIMGLRFVQDLLERHARVSLAIPGNMITLAQAQSWPLERVLDIEAMSAADVEGVDYHTPMWSAMRWLGYAEPSQLSGAAYLHIPSLRASANTVQQDPTAIPSSLLFLSPEGKQHIDVGICWASGKRNDETDWRRRVSRLEDWLTLAELPHIRLHSLLKGPESAEIEDTLSGGLISDPTDGFTDWLDTARFISGLDLVITVDTAVAHLAGALGCRTWMLSQHVPCWRWWGLRDGSGWPWYDSMSIIPQLSAGDWRSQLAECRRRFVLPASLPLSAAA